MSFTQITQAPVRLNRSQMFVLSTDPSAIEAAPQRRPHYSPHERLAILELRAARGWSQANRQYLPHHTGHDYIVDETH